MHVASHRVQFELERSHVYIPRANEEKRISVMHQLIADHPLGSLVTLGSSGLIATHLPLVLEQEGTEFGTLKGHISRANLQGRDLSSSIDALAIFAGPQHYISPTWYPGKQVDGKEVPTWNYAVVHAYGSLQVIEDPAWLLAHLTALTDIHEAGSTVPWQVGDAPADFIDIQLRGIVGINLPIRVLQGKWKVSQNRTQRDRVGILHGLAELNTPEASGIKDLVQDRSPAALAGSTPPNA